MPAGTDRRRPPKNTDAASDGASCPNRPAAALDEWGVIVDGSPSAASERPGWQRVAEWVSQDIQRGEALCKAPLPDWVLKGPVVKAVMEKYFEMNPPQGPPPGQLTQSATTKPAAAPARALDSQTE